MSSYKTSLPVSQKTYYTSSDNIDFKLSFPNMSVVGNTIRLSGNLQVYKDATPTPVTAQNIYYDGMCGIHSFFNNLVVSSQLKGIVENQSEYPRWIKMKNSATFTNSQIVSDSKSLNQLLFSDFTLSNSYLNSKLPFSCHLDICLNNVVNNGVLNYSTWGDITLSVRIVQAIECLFGSDMTNDVNFRLTDLSCDYLTVQELKDKSPVLMTINYPLKQTINSANAMLDVKLPSIINKVSCSFLQQSQQYQMTFNNLELQQPSGIYKLFYNFNNSTTGYVSYPVESLVDMIDHYLASFSNYDNKNDCTVKKVQDDKFFGVGLDFAQNIDLSNSSFGLNILSSISGVTPFYIFMYFQGLIQV